MHVLAFDKAGAEAKREPRKLAAATGGLAGWVLSAMSGLRVAGQGKPSERQMQVVERLSLGPKKDLLLVRCGSELFLIGTGPDRVQTIVPVPRSAAAACDELTR